MKLKCGIRWFKFEVNDCLSIKQKTQTLCHKKKAKLIIYHMHVHVSIGWILVAHEKSCHALLFQPGQAQRRVFGIQYLRL